MHILNGKRRNSTHSIWWGIAITSALIQPRAEGDSPHPLTTKLAAALSPSVNNQGHSATLIAQ